MDFLQLWLKITSFMGGFPFSKITTQSENHPVADANESKENGSQPKFFVKNTKLYLWSNIVIVIYQLLLILMIAFYFHSTIYENMNTAVHKLSLEICVIAYMISISILILRFGYKRDQLFEIMNEIERKKPIKIDSKSDFFDRFLKCTVFVGFLTSFIMSSYDNRNISELHENMVIVIIVYIITTFLNAMIHCVMLSNISLMHCISKEIAVILVDYVKQIENISRVKSSGYSEFEVESLIVENIEILYDKITEVYQLQKVINSYFYVPVIIIIIDCIIAFGYNIFCLTTLGLNDIHSSSYFISFMFGCLLPIIQLCLIPDTVLNQVK